MKSFRTWGPFLEALGNYRARYAILFFIPDGSLKSFENCTVKLSAKQAKLTSLEFRTHPTFLETLISKYDFGPVELPGLSRNGPLENHAKSRSLWLLISLIHIFLGSIPFKKFRACTPLCLNRNGFSSQKTFRGFSRKRPPNRPFLGPVSRKTR